MLEKGFAECFRVLKPNGTLVFKWAESQFPIKDVLALTPEKPLFGHKTSKTTHWAVFIKPPASAIETGTAETVGLGPKAESAAAKPDAQSEGSNV
jgi:hypothetical protein